MSRSPRFDLVSLLPPLPAVTVPLPFPLPHNKKFMANLYNSAKEGVDTTDVLSFATENGCRFGEKCSHAHRQVDEQPSKNSKKNGDKSAVAVLKSTRQLGCVFQDMEPPKSSSILRKSSNIRKPIQRVRFTEAVLRHADIRDQNPSFGMSCPSSSA